MGFLGKGRKAKARNLRTTIVAEGTRISGELNVSANLHVDGSVEGSIVCEHGVSVGRTGEVDGEIVAHHVVISGHMKGRVECERLEIVSTGQVFAEVVSREFMVEPGAQFVGENRRKGDEPPKALTHQETDADPEIDMDIIDGTLETDMPAKPNP